MNSDTSARNRRRDLELEVEAEGWEWMRKRLAQKLQAQVEQEGAISPQAGEKHIIGGAKGCNCARPSGS
jgi:uncharacterized protein YdaU (DUF1376 family)